MARRASEIVVTTVFVDSQGRQITSSEPRPQNAKVVKEGDTWVMAECDGVLGSEHG